MLVLALMSTGCEKHDPQRVPPPESATIGGVSPDASPSVAPQPPGEMEWPEQLIDMPNVDENQSSDGFEMPKDLGSTEQVGKTIVRYANWESIQAIVGEAGRPTVIDLWSLSCQPCMEEFPGLVRLHRDLGDEIQCIAVNVDFDGRKRRPPSHYEPRVRAFLDQVSAGDLPNIICETASDDVYKLADVSSLPSVLIFDGEGNLVKKYVDVGETIGFGYDKDIRPLVDSMLALTRETR